jgi:hypothetical protein
MLKNADYAFRRFQEVKRHINFSRWKAPHDLVDAEEHELETVTKKAVGLGPCS